MDATAQLTTSPSKRALVDAFVGRNISSLRTPAFVINEAIVKRNCAEMLHHARDCNALFRAHVKTHKTAEGVRHQLATPDSDHRQLGGAIVVSTQMEAWQVLRHGLIADGTVQDVITILYGLPVPLNKVPEMGLLKHELEAHGSNFRLLVDHPEQIARLRAYVAESKTPVTPWSVFVKVDPGYKRAGVVPGSAEFLALMENILEAGTSVDLYGFYCHAGNSYGSKTLTEASSYLSDEIDTVLKAARIARTGPTGTYDLKTFVLSVGSTPTAHVPSNSIQLNNSMNELQNLLGRNILELHAGNYIFYDLQQLATSLIEPSAIAFRILATVISIYPGRGANEEDEALIDVGGIGLSKDTGPMEGYGKVVAIFPPSGSQNSRTSTEDEWLLDMNFGWTLARISQEHGILRKDATGGADLKVGSVVALIGQHACLVAANHPWYYVVDSNAQKASDQNVVVDVWVPWKGW
ncbi:hypothetical protein FRB90_009864 [Tulasnella sp. 427]|nr:hypothetical protein FRB90_009864 [Tulasnella sp. 427]